METLLTKFIVDGIVRMRNITREEALHTLFSEIRERGETYVKKMYVLRMTERGYRPNNEDNTAWVNYAKYHMPDDLREYLRQNGYDIPEDDSGTDSDSDSDVERYVRVTYNRHLDDVVPMNIRYWDYK